MEKENKALNIKFVKLDQMDVENSVLNLKITLLSWQRYILVKMLLKFFKQGEVKQTHKWSAQSKADILNCCTIKSCYHNGLKTEITLHG